MARNGNRNGKKKPAAPGAGKRPPSAAKRPADAGTHWLAWLLGSGESYEGYFAQSRSLALSFVLIAPLLLAYEAALVYYPAASERGAGGFIRDVLTAVFRTRAGLVLNIVVLSLLVVAIFVLAHRRHLRLYLIVPMILESMAFAAVFVGVAALLYQRYRVLPGGRAGVSGSVLMSYVMDSVGAGVYEEILFRLCLTSALYYAGLKLFMDRSGRAALFAICAGAFVFAMCHMMAPGARPLSTSMGRFDLGFYFLGGLFFSMLYTFRGLGVAVYTHVLYDLIVLIGK